jgi:hypothetical protein
MENFRNAFFRVERYGSGTEFLRGCAGCQWKILARFNYTFSYDTKIATIYGNSAIMARAKGIESILTKFQPLEISVLNGRVTITYANFPPVTTSIKDPAADWKKPKTLRQYFFGRDPAFPVNMDFMDMRFYKDYSADIFTAHINKNRDANRELKVTK